MIAIQTANPMNQMNHLKIAKMKKTQNSKMTSKMNLEKMKTMRVLTDLKKEWKMNKKSIHKIIGILNKQKLINSLLYLQANLRTNILRNLIKAKDKTIINL
jgi:hypothetical protein